MTPKLTSSEQARADAMADAESLVREVQGMSGVEPVARYMDGPAVFAAGKYGSDAAWHAQHGSPQASRLAKRAAHAAFRAVPGLRGEGR